MKTLDEIVLLDANVLYSASMRDVLVEIAVRGHFQARWTDEIQDEWIEALLRNEPHQDRKKLEGTRARMNEKIADATIAGYEHIIPTLELPDPGDLHVLAAAIVGQCDIILTENLKDFPKETLDAHKITAHSPDDFIAQILILAPKEACLSFKSIRGRLENPPRSREEYLANLEGQNLKKTVALIREHHINEI